MKVLIADDDKITQLILERLLKELGFEVVVASNGADAWRALQEPDPPRIALLDWMMPEIDGIEVCRRIREHPQTRAIYTMLLTMKAERRDIVEGLGQGADDYIIKPFNREELAARIRAGARIVKMQSSLAEKIADLERALSLVKRLEGIIPICSYCKKVRDDRQYWHSVEEFVSENSEAHFSHSICPHCFDAIVEPMMDYAAAKPSDAEEKARLLTS